MSDTTKDNVLAIAPELKDIPLSTIKMILADVAVEVGAGYGEKQEQAQRYLAAHYLTIINPDNVDTKSSAPGGIKSEGLGDERVTYNGFQGIKNRSRYDSTTYGQIFQSIKGGSILAATFVTP